MATMNNIAHPYAKAAFELAFSANMQDMWLVYLKNLSQVVQDAAFINLISNPKVTNEQLLGVLFEVLENSANNVDNEVIGLDGIKGFLCLLSESHRLQVLPEIHSLFERLCNEAKNQAEAVIQTAFAMSVDDRLRIEALLSKKMGKKITASVEICPQLIGGIKISINDVVIDASVMGSLNKMATQLIQ